MRRAKWSIALAMLVVTAASGTAEAQPAQISGTIATTLTIYRDAGLVVDVTCQVGAACVRSASPTSHTN